MSEHRRIALSACVFGRRRRVDDGRIHNRPSSNLDSNRPRRIPAHFAVSELDLERLAKDVFVAILCRGSPVLVCLQPSINVRRLNLVGNEIAKAFQNDVHPNAKVLTAVLDLPIDCLVPDGFEPRAFVLHIRRELHATSASALRNL
jgi:hypothetical protein